MASLSTISFAPIFVNTFIERRVSKINSKYRKQKFQRKSFFFVLEDLTFWSPTLHIFNCELIRLLGEHPAEEKCICEALERNNRRL